MPFLAYSLDKVSYFVRHTEIARFDSTDEINVAREISLILKELDCFSFSFILIFFKFFFHFKFFLITVAPSTKSGCFSGGRGKNLITMLIKQVNKEKEYLQC